MTANRIATSLDAPPYDARRMRHMTPRLIGPVLRIFLEAVEDRLKAASPGAPAEARFGAVTFVHRFGSALNANLHRRLGRDEPAPREQP